MLGLGLGLNRTIGRVRPKNEVAYDPATWAEWVKNANVDFVCDSTGMEVISTGAYWGSAYIDTQLKPSAQYGILLEIVSTTLTKPFYVDPTSKTFPVWAFSPYPTIGYKKVVRTIYATPALNRFQVTTTDTEPAGNSIKIKDIRLFELPTGSQIEADFNNLTADQLNAKYPF